MAMAVSKQWTRVRALGRGASGAEVFLAADDKTGELFAVKSARASGAAALRREQGAMSGLSNPGVVSCIGGRAGRDGSYHLFLEFAPGGSLADEVARCGGSLDEPTVRAYAADVARALAYLHGAGLVHGDVKARNVLIGADGRAKLADFGCARRSAGSAAIIGGTPAFMAPEVARGEGQGPVADVWALGCTVVEMATGRAPWSGADGDALAVMHRIGYTNAVPEVPRWLSAQAKDFLRMCLARRASDRCTAAQLLEHPFLASAGVHAKLEVAKSRRVSVSPKSTLDAAFWDSESDSEEADDSTAERIKALACPASALPEWEDSEEGWIDVLSVSAPTEEASESSAESVPVEETAKLDEEIRSLEPAGECSGLVDIAVDCSGYASILGGVGEANDGSVWPQDLHQPLETLLLACVNHCFATESVLMQLISFVPAKILCSPVSLCMVAVFFFSCEFLCSPLALRHVG